MACGANASVGPAVLVSRPQPDVLLLTLNRPKNRNAVTGEMIDLLVRELDAATHDATVRAVVVAGNPAGRAFCAGADLAPGNGLNTAGRKGEPLGGAAYRDAGGYSSLAALRCTKPIIAAINGSAVGWGLAFPLAADLRVVSETAKLGFTMAARGLVNESCSSWLLPRIVGPTKAKELVFTGRVFLGKDAAIHAPGLFNYVLPQDQVVVKALELAREMADNVSGLSLSLCKFLMDESWEMNPEQAMLQESAALHHVNHVKKLDLKEGIGSFLEKRRPSWKHTAWSDLPDFAKKPRVNVRPICSARSKL